MTQEDDFIQEAIRNLRNRSCRLEREGDYWTRDENERLTEMFHDGTGISSIAIRLQRTEFAVMQQIQKLDLYCRKEYPRRRSRQRVFRCRCNSCLAPLEDCPRSQRENFHEEG